jgi:hypothetical protein
MITPGKLFQLGSWLVCIGAVASIVTSIAGSLAYALAADQASSLWLSIQTVGIVAALLFSLGLPAVYFYQAYETRLIGLWGFVLTEAATIIGGIGYSLVITIVTSTLSAAVMKQDTHLAYGLYALSTVASLLFFAGSGLFGYAAWKGKVYPRNVGMFLLAGCLISLGQALPDPIVSVSVGVLSQVCFYGAFFWMGMIIIRQGHVIDQVQGSYEPEQKELETEQRELATVRKKKDVEATLEKMRVEALADQNN